MSLQCGIVGLPNVGKSTLFNALTSLEAAAQNFPFCTIEPNRGIVSVPDARLERLADLVAPEKTIPTSVTFIDIAGLVAGASKGEGLGNQFLGNIREADAIIHVVRCFDDEEVIHVAGRVSAVDDVEIINTELALADLESVENQISRIQRLAGSGDRDARKRHELLQYLLDSLQRGIPVRSLSFHEEQRLLLREFNLLTDKPVLYVANSAENPDSAAADLTAVQKIAAEENAGFVALSVRLEAELAAMEPADALEMLEALGLEQTGLTRIIRSSYQLLGLLTFFTAGPSEVRAWSVRQGSVAPAAAGVIHSDFEKQFIRAEVVSWEDYIACGGEAGARREGKWRLEGKDYIVQDGDVLFFRHGA